MNGLAVGTDELVQRRLRPFGADRTGFSYDPPMRTTRLLVGVLTAALLSVAGLGCGGASAGAPAQEAGRQLEGSNATDLPFGTGAYAGTTSQGLPISFTVAPATVDAVAFRWRARCADGRIHMNGILLGGTSIRDARFSVGGLLATGGRAQVSGRLEGSRASGRLSRWANSAFHTVCVARGVSWHAHRVPDNTDQL